MHRLSIRSYLDHRDYLVQISRTKGFQVWHCEVLNSAFCRLSLNRATNSTSHYASSQPSVKRLGCELAPPRPRSGLSVEKGRRVRVRRVFAGEIMALSWLGNTLVCSPKKRWRAWLEERKVWASLLRWLPPATREEWGQFTANEQWAGWDNPRREKQSNLNFQHNLKFNFSRCSIMSFSRKWSLKCSWMGPNFG